MAFIASAQEYFLDRLIVKVKNEHRNFCSDSKINVPVFEKISAEKNIQVIRKFKKESLIAHKKQRGFVDLSLIYELRFDERLPFHKLINSLNGIEVFEYVEPKYIRSISYTPNDPDVSLQTYLNVVKAFQGWDIQKGNSNITIAIVDTGTDLDHPELVSKIKTNTNDPANGVDDDNDGFIDNFQGWDFTTDDNDPQVTFNDHGVTVAGAAVAAADNNIGIAGVGFDCSYLPVKVGEYTAITEGYEGIKYAADMGADIINCSWGGFDASQFEQDVVNYATINKGALVIAAAGNQGLSDNYYPASYDYVLGVAATLDDDRKASFSNYGYWIGISAPGNDIYSTANNDGYRLEDGTSLASPIVAGAAALVKAEYPSLSGPQLAERLKETADNIDGMNASYIDMLGAGRLNLENALTGSIANPAIVLTEKKFEDGNDNALQIGDTIDISARYTNFLAPSGVLTATISTTSSHVTILNNQFSIGTLVTQAFNDNHSAPYRVKIENTAPKNEEVVFKITVTDGSYSKDFYEKVYVNVDYLNIEENRVGLTVTSKGLIGYNQKDQKQGIGARLDGSETMMFEGGLMIGAVPVTSQIVVDNIRNTGTLSDQNFSPLESIYPLVPTVEADFEAVTSFTDTNSFSDKIQVKVDQEVKVWDEAGHDNYVILEYNVINLRNEPQKEVYVGMITDFDIADYEKNRFSTKPIKYLGYSYSTEPNTPVAGVQILNQDEVKFYGIDNVVGGNGGVDIRNGFFSPDKYEVLSTNRFGAGYVNPDGNDILQCVSAEIGEIPVGDTAKVVFAVILADDTNQLFAAADSAYARYNGFLPNSVEELANNSIENVFPNPVANGELNFTLKNGVEVEAVRVIGITGNILLQQSHSFRNAGKLDVSHLSNGTYWLQIQTTKGISSRPFVVLNDKN